jgi:soluble lytic murein transglycosylase-like protein
MRVSSSFRLQAGIVAILAALTLPCLADEVAVLKNGFSIRHERREVVGEVTRLYLSSDGASFVDVPTADIEHYEEAPALTASDSASPARAAQLKSPKASPFAREGQNGVPTLNLDDVINTASDRYRLDPDLVNSVIKAESGFKVHAVSPKGAQGLMQLMPGTASQLGVPNAFDPQANVEGGTKYLRELLERYDFDLVKALAAYNAGPQRVEQFGGVPPYYETKAYVARIVRDFNKKKIAQGKATRPAQQAMASGKAGAKAGASTAKSHKPSSVTQAKAGPAQPSE